MKSVASNESEASIAPCANDRARHAVAIGISSYPRDGAPLSFSLPCGYVDAVRAAGGIPLVLPTGEDRPEAFLDLVAGLIVSGGGDLEPALYGGRSHETVYMVSQERDRFELSLTRAALGRTDVPLLFICRGLQVLNVFCGGTLHVDLPDLSGATVNHRLPPHVPTRHRVRIDADSRLARILGATDVEVCSWHHQGIDRVGRGLRPVAWAADGVVEAVEHTTHPWCIGIQWHPEMQLAEVEQTRLFAALVEAARSAVPREARPQAGKAGGNG